MMIAIKEKWISYRKKAGDIDAPLFLTLVFAGGGLAFFTPDSRTAIIGGTVALIIGFVAYPWQKDRDRELKISEEKRQCYHRFFDAAELFFAKLRIAAFKVEVPLPDDEFATLEAAKADLAFRGSEAALEKCVEYCQNLKDYRTYVKLCREAKATAETRSTRDRLYTAVNTSRVEAIIAARRDAKIIDGTEASEATVRKLFQIKDQD